MSIRIKTAHYTYNDRNNKHKRNDGWKVYPGKLCLEGVQIYGYRDVNDTAKYNLGNVLIQSNRIKTTKKSKKMIPGSKVGPFSGFKIDPLSSKPNYVYARCDPQTANQLYQNLALAY